MRTCVTPLLWLALLVGCGKPQFSHRAEYDQLESYAQEYVDQVLDGYFGGPVDMKVWERLPLQMHLAQGVVKIGAERSLQLELADSVEEVPAGTEVAFRGGSMADHASAFVRSWDDETSTAELESRLSQAPEAGQPVILGPGGILVRGRKLYAEHCQHCHGVAGDGNGPTAQYLNPRPRDYRKGIFKFTVTKTSERASRSDLARIIEEGIPGTYMPSFKLLAPDEMQAIVEYIRWLSMRGEVEFQLVKFLSNDYSKDAVKRRLADAREKKKAGAEEVESYNSIRQDFWSTAQPGGEIPGELESIFELMVTRWTAADAEDALLAPQQKHVAYTPESVALGRKLYLSADLNCVACHGDAGFGDGPQTYSITKDLETGADNPAPGLYDVWGNPIEPRNLHAGIFRGGRRPIDVYARIHAGIKGTPMPAFGAKLKDEDIWHLVNYIYSVPFEKVTAGGGKQTPPTATEGDVASR